MLPCLNAQKLDRPVFQLHDVWRAIGYVDIARHKTGWGAQRRRGFAVETGEPAALDEEEKSPVTTGR